MVVVVNSGTLRGGKHPIPALANYCISNLYGLQYTGLISRCIPLNGL